MHDPSFSHNLLRGFCLVGTFQSFPPPDALHSIFAHVPACLVQQCRNASLAVAAIFTGQSNDRFGQFVFIAALCRLITLRASRLIHQPASMPFAQPLFPSMSDGDPSPLGT